MAGRDASDDGFASIDQGLAAFLDWFGQTKRAWQLEDMVRDLIPPDVGNSAHGDEFVETIITRLAATPVGVSALHVMGIVAVPLVALAARSAVRRVAEEGGPKPSALARRCGGLDPAQAWRMTAQDGVDAFLLLCRRTGNTRVQLAFIATMDAGDGPILVEGSLGDPLPESDVRHLLEAFEAQGLRTQAVTLAEMAGQIVTLAGHNIATDRGPTAELLLVLVAVLPHLDVAEWEGLVTALTMLPLAEVAGDDDDWYDDAWDDDDGEDDKDLSAIHDPVPLADLEVKRIERDLRQLSARFDAWIAEHEDDDDRRELAGGLATTMFEYRAWYRNGDPWDERMLTEFLMAHMPRAVEMGQDDLVATPLVVPDVLEFLAESGDISTGMLAELTELVSRLGPEFFAAMTDPANFGMAKRITDQMGREGLDPTDREALQEWMADFNARPIDERAEMLPDSMLGLPPTPPPAPGGDWADRDAARRKRNVARDARKKNRRRGR